MIEVFKLKRDNVGRVLAWLGKYGTSSIEPDSLFVIDNNENLIYTPANSYIIRIMNGVHVVMDEDEWKEFTDYKSFEKSHSGVYGMDYYVDIYRVTGLSTICFYKE